MIGCPLVVNIQKCLQKPFWSSIRDNLKSICLNLSEKETIHKCWLILVLGTHLTTDVSMPECQATGPRAGSIRDALLACSGMLLL